MSDYRFSTGDHHGIACLHVLIDGDAIAETHIPIDDILKSAKLKGRGVLRVSAVVMAELDSSSTDALRKALLLPDTYEIEHIQQVNYGDTRDGVYELFLLSDEIPVSNAHLHDVQVMPIYCKTLNEETGTYDTDLVRIDIEQWTSEGWKKVGNV